MSKIYVTRYKSPVGELVLGDYNNTLCMADWLYRSQRATIDNRITAFLNATYVEKETPLHIETIKQLTAYFNKERTKFKLPLTYCGTSFQQEVWMQLEQISYGTVTSYAALANTMAQPKAIRAIAAANGANALSIIVPCHRIIASNGSMQGYAGCVAVKEKLLQLEGALLYGQHRLF